MQPRPVARGAGLLGCESNRDSIAPLHRYIRPSALRSMLQESRAITAAEPLKNARFIRQHGCRDRAIVSADLERRHSPVLPASPIHFGILERADQGLDLKSGKFLSRAEA